MGRERHNWIAWAFVALTILIAALILAGTFRRTTRIELPAPGGDTENEQIVQDGFDSMIDVTPRTVQAAIASLERPESYSRTITVEQFWGEESLSYQISTSVRGGMTRTERVLADGQVRYCITDGRSTWVWYDNGDAECIAAGKISADLEQMIPTYEEILELSADRIETADFRLLSGITCIYVELLPDENNAVTRYWVSLESGLLCAAERLIDGETVYRMGALSVDLQLPGEEKYVLPDGTSLL